MFDISWIQEYKRHLEADRKETEVELEEIQQAFEEGEAEMKAGTLYSLDDFLERAAQILANSKKFKLLE